MVISFTFICFYLNICCLFRSPNAQYLKLQTLNPYFVQMHLAFFLFFFWHFFFLHFRQCPSIRKLGQSIDPFEVISHKFTPFSFLQCYCECKLNEQKDKELRGWTPKSCGNLITLNVLWTCESTSSVWLWSSSLNLCSFTFFQFSI